MASIHGTNAGDSLYGTAAADIITGNGGDDVLKGFGGADWLIGGTGIDTAFYGDSPTGVVITLADGRAWGGSAEDDLLIHIENLYGSSHDDDLTGWDDANRLFGLGGNDTLRGEHGDDVLDGSIGDDTLKGGGGADVLIGDIGFDTVNYGGSPAGVAVSLMSNSAASGDAQGDSLSGIEGLVGSDFADTLQGDGSGNRLSGSPGDDQLDGLGGDDTLVGGPGADTMLGGRGNDIYEVDDLADRIVENGGQGIDTVYAERTYALTDGADVEALLAIDRASTDAIDLTGNANGNQVVGNNGPNVINGGNGRDDLMGLGGQDSFLFDTPLNAAINLDIIGDFSIADDTIVLENTIFGAFAAGDLAEERFVTSAPQQANDNIIYDQATGTLHYDSDGNGAASAVQFAQVTAGLALTHLDFVVV
jgi:Ca2+-binding RTX toxin-like protein